MAENEPMLGLLRHLGFVLKASEEPGVVRASFELHPAAAHEAALPSHTTHS